MPVNVSMICIRNTKAEEFLQSSQFLGLKKKIHKQRMESDGLYLAMKSSRNVYLDSLSELDENDYLYLLVDDEEDFRFWGSFLPSEEVGIATTMSIIVTDIEEEEMIDDCELYNTDFLKNLKRNDIEKLKNLIFEDGELKDWYEDDVINEVEALCPGYQWDYQSQKWAFFELGFFAYTEDSIFVATCQPSLQSIIKWKSNIDDDLEEWREKYGDNEDNFAYSVYTTFNKQLLDIVKEKLGQEEEFMNHPAIRYFDEIGNAIDGWRPN